MRSWGTVAGEQELPLPGDELLPDAPMVLHRAVGVAAPAAVTFRWLCQLRVAPYSYDWIDNGGRRSPRRLVPGLEDLAVGQRFCRIFTLESFARDEHVTLRITAPAARRAFGEVVLTYAVLPAGPAASRLLARVRVAGLDPVRRRALALGDLVMMRRQLHTLASLAEQTT